MLYFLVYSFFDLILYSFVLVFEIKLILKQLILIDSGIHHFVHRILQIDIASLEYYYCINNFLIFAHFFDQKVSW